MQIKTYITCYVINIIQKCIFSSTRSCMTSRKQEFPSKGEPIIFSHQGNHRKWLFYSLYKLLLRTQTHKHDKKSGTDSRQHNVHLQTKCLNVTCTPSLTQRVKSTKWLTTQLTRNIKQYPMTAAHVCKYHVYHGWKKLKLQFLSDGNCYTFTISDNM